MRPDQRRRQDAHERAFEIITSKAAPFVKSFPDCVTESGKVMGAVADLVAVEMKPKYPEAFKDFPEVSPAHATAWAYSVVGNLRVGKARSKSFAGKDATDVANQFMSWWKDVLKEKQAYSRHTMKARPQQ